MSNILDAREKLLRMLRGTDFSPSMDHAFNEWIHGRPAKLKKNFPGVYRLLGQHSDFLSALLEYTSCLEIDEIQMLQVKNANIVKPVILALKQPSIQDRPFDIVSDYDLLVELEMFPINCDILDHDRNWIKSRKEANKQCLVGFIVVIFENHIFKKQFGLKKGHFKIITLHDAMLYGHDRYNFGSMESTRRDLDHCKEMALTRMPGLRQFDERNKKNQTNFKH